MDGNALHSDEPEAANPAAEGASDSASKLGASVAVDGGAEPASNGDCDLNQATGITEDAITLGVVADVSGPIPGLLEGNKIAVEAFAAFFNQTSSICGRKLSIKFYDSRTDAKGSQEAYIRACEETFAVIGSMSTFDAGGAAEAEECGLPDLRAGNGTIERLECATCFGVQGLEPNVFQNAVPDYVKKTSPGAEDSAAYLYINAGAVPANAKYQVAAMSRQGVTFKYVAGIEVADFNYGPYVQRLREADIEYLHFMGATAHAVRLAQAMRQQGYWPEVLMQGSPVYTNEYVETGGSDVDEAVVYLSHVPFEQADRNTELATYLAWVDRMKPGSSPTTYGLYGWSAMRLFTELATKLGSDLDRASLVGAIANVRNWEGLGAHAPQNTGGKQTGNCWQFVAAKNGQWVTASSEKFICSGTTSVPR